MKENKDYEFKLVNTKVGESIGGSYIRERLGGCITKLYIGIS